MKRKFVDNWTCVIQTKDGNNETANISKNYHSVSDFIKDVLEFTVQNPQKYRGHYMIKQSSSWIDVI